MAVRILIPTPLRAYAGRQEAVTVEAKTVGEALDALTREHASLKRHLFGDDGKLRNFVNVYRNDEDVRYLEKDATPLAPGDTLSIVPSIAGGADTIAAKGAPFTSEEIKRYSRHLILPEVGMEGQKKLKAGSALLVGAGGLGSPLGLYLAAAGVGRIGIVDFDVVDSSNLQRQVLHGTKDVGRPKLESARERIHDMNPNVTVDTWAARLTSENAMDILAKYDVVADGTDNFPTRYLVNDACVLLGKPNVYGSIFRFEGQASVFHSPLGPCYRCLYPEPPPPGLVPSCAEGGVLGILPGVVGLIQATETVKVLLGIGETLVGRLLLYDALAMRFRELKLRKNPDCPLCGTNPTIRSLIDYEAFCGITAAENQGGSQVGIPEITASELKRRMDLGDPIVLIDVREPHEYAIANIPGSKLIPLGELPARVNELDSASQIVMHCHHGMRSATAVGFLRDMGFRRVENLRGGIDEWAADVDPEMPRY